MKNKLKYFIVFFLTGLFLISQFSIIQAIQSPPWGITSDFGPRTLSDFFHNGIDYAAYYTPIQAVESGNINTIKEDGNGIGVFIDSSSGQWRYYHLFSGLGDISDELLVFRDGLFDLRKISKTDATFVIVIWNIDQTTAVKALCKKPGFKVYDKNNFPIKKSDGSYLMTESYVYEGDFIAISGHSGTSSPHLHLGLWMGGDAINPLYYLSHPLSNFWYSFSGVPTAVDKNDLLSPNIPISVEINSQAGLDLNKVDFFIDSWQNNIVTFGYGGAPGEGSPTAT